MNLRSRCKNLSGPPLKKFYEGQSQIFLFIKFTFSGEIFMHFKRVFRLFWQLFRLIVPNVVIFFSEHLHLIFHHTLLQYTHRYHITLRNWGDHHHQAPLASLTRKNWSSTHWTVLRSRAPGTRVPFIFFISVTESSMLVLPVHLIGWWIDPRPPSKKSEKRLAVQCSSCSGEMNH